MKKILLIILCIVGIFLVAGCQDTAPKEPQTKDVVCQNPYIKSGSGCCLDENSNRICDDKEIQENRTPEAPKVYSVRQKPEEIRYCNISYAINWADSPNPCYINRNDVVAKLRFTGKGDKIDGMWFYVTTESGKEKYLRDTKELKTQESRDYTINVDEPITKIIALPRTLEDGKEKACLNQRMLVVSSGVCGN